MTTMGVKQVTGEITAQRHATLKTVCTVGERKVISVMFVVMVII